VNIDDEVVKRSITMEGVQSLPPHQQQEFMKHLENMQMKDGLL
jgi:hypothetical protein